MRITQGTFSFLPDLSDEEIALQVDYALRQQWACSIEFTDDPHPRNTYWDMWSPPMFDLRDSAGFMQELQACRATYPRHYIKINAFDSVRGVESVRLSFIVNRPAHEPGFRLLREEGQGRVQRYSMAGYAAGREAGERYDA
jgi:ribulose-bisphosphate carboxylase small chain